MYVTSRGVAPYGIGAPPEPRYRWLAWAPPALKPQSAAIILTRVSPGEVTLCLNIQMEHGMPAGRAAIRAYPEAADGRAKPSHRLELVWEKNNPLYGSSMTTFRLAKGAAVRVQLMVDKKVFRSPALKP